MRERNFHLGRATHAFDCQAVAILSHALDLFVDLGGGSAKWAWEQLGSIDLCHLILQSYDIQKLGCPRKTRLAFCIRRLP